MIDMTKVLELIGKNPGIRTVQISDRLDCDLAELRGVLHEETQRGSAIVAHNVTAPNGRAAIAYTLVGVPLPDTLATAADGGKPKTNVERAIEFIEAQPDGKATSAQLHTLLGLKADEYASQYLGGAVKDGRLVKDGKFWSLGTGKKVESAPPPAPAPANTPEPKQKPQTEAPKAPAEKAPAAAEPVEVPQFLKKGAAPTAQAVQKSLEVEKPAAAPEHLKIRMIEEPTFTIQLGPVTLSGMRQVSEWNGIKELRDSQGRALIVLAEDGQFVRMFDAMLGKKEQDITVIKGHPELIHQLAAAIDAERNAA